MDSSDSNARAGADRGRPSITRALLLVLAALSVIVLTPATVSAEGDAVVSIHATYDANPTPDAGCGGMRVVGRGTATGVPVGHALWSDEECASLLATPGKITIAGILVVTAASGDRLEASYSATADLPEPDGTIRPAGTFQIIGGTGRFSNATGSGTINATANMFHPQAVADMNGFISYG